MRTLTWLAGAALVLLVATGCTSTSTGTGYSPIPLPATSPAGPPPPTPHPRHHHHRHHHHYHHAPPPTPSGSPAGAVPAVDRPDPALTPGVALPVSAARVCVPGYAGSVRDVSDAEKASVYERYGIPWVPYRHEVDHLISLELGGSNAIRNLWPEPYAGRWGARTKDVLENRLHELVCADRLSLASAQHQEASNWVAAYRRYVGAPPSGANAGASAPGGSTSSPGGFYASSYPSASTIYCADDPTWRELSRRYLVHFATFAQARRHFPSYHLHQPC